MKVAKRASIAPFHAMEVLRAANARAASGAEVLHMEVGEPSGGAPAAVIEAAKRALDVERIGYTEALGIPALREGLSRHYREVHGLDLPAERIVATTGSSGGFLLAFLSAFDAGDRIALANPSYPAYRNILNALGLEAVSLPAGPETNFQPSPALLRQAGKLDGVLIASPANPTGAMFAPGALGALLGYCRTAGIRVISDEIYHGITYGRAAESALSFGSDAIVINSFSKYFSMTGWRIGWMVVPEDLLRPVERLAQNLFISPPALAQHAGVAALGCRAECDAKVESYRRNRALMLETLPKAGFEIAAPADGAFYIYADVRKLTNDSAEFCRRMLAETGVAATPGIDFDVARGNAYMRFSFAGSEADIAEAMRKLRAWSR
jgi:aspartate/methionine/tyrosine aminotransferase